MLSKNNILRHVGFGCAGLSAQPTKKAALRLLKVAFDEGITHFDTAPLYGKGYSEKILGSFLKGRRGECTVTTKFGLPSKGNSNLPIALALPLNYLRKILKKKSVAYGSFEKPDPILFRGIGLDLIRDSFEKSLQNLRTDYIDYYLLHEALPAFLSEEALQYIFELKSKGAVNKIGIASSYNNIESIQPDSLKNWDILQYENSLLHPSDELRNIFPDKIHIYHSIFKPLKYTGSAPELRKELPGILLAKALINNPGGMAVFSTSKYENIKENLQNLNLYMKYSPDRINNILLSALH